MELCKAELIAQVDVAQTAAKHCLWMSATIRLCVLAARETLLLPAGHPDASLCCKVSCSKSCSHWACFRCLSSCSWNKAQAILRWNWKWSKGLELGGEAWICRGEKHSEVPTRISTRSSIATTSYFFCRQGSMSGASHSSPHQPY